MNITKASVGIDVSMDDFHTCVKVRTEDGSVKIKGTRTFDHTEQGYRDFLSWSKKKATTEKAVYTMEATGTYYEDLAYFLYGQGHSVSVVLANKIKNYAKSLNVKTKTDKVDSKVIAEYGIERNERQWKPMTASYKILRDLSREILSLNKEKVRAKSQLHAINYSHEKSELIKQQKQAQIAIYEKMITELKNEIENVVSQEPELKEKIKKLETIPGIRFYTVVAILCETNGFELFRNIRQVVSYAGLDIAIKESGTLKGKTRISKKGNGRIRQVLYMPAMSAIRSNAPIKKLHERICEKNPNVRNKGVIAAMRKLLILIFVLWKKNEQYDPNYQWG